MKTIKQTECCWVKSEGKCPINDKSCPLNPEHKTKKQRSDIE